MFIIVAGIGVLGSEVVKNLTRKKHDIVAIDIDKKVCENIYEETGVTAIHGNATDINTLKNAGADRTDTLLCLMPNDADNIALSLLGKSLGVKNIIACLRKPGYNKAYKLSGVTSLIRLPDLFIHQVIAEVEQPDVKKITELKEGKASVFAVNIGEKSKSVNMKIKDIVTLFKIPEESVFLGIYNEETDEFKIPRGHSILKAKDTVFIISKDDKISLITKYLL
jgi:trk system potassium uptake protein TrkA